MFELVEKHDPLRDCDCHDCALVERDRLRVDFAKVRYALARAEAALADIGDADREPGDDVAWCEKRAASVLTDVRAALKQTTPNP